MPNDPENAFGPWFLRSGDVDEPRNSVFPLIETEATQLFRLAARWSVASTALARELRDSHADQHSVRSVSQRAAIAGLLAWQVATVEFNLYRWSIDPAVNHWMQRLNQKTVNLSPEMFTALSRVVRAGLVAPSSDDSTKTPNVLQTDSALNAFVGSGPLQPIDPTKVGFRPGFFSTTTGARDLATLLRPTAPQTLPADWQFLLAIASSTRAKVNILNRLAEFDASLDLPALPSEVRIQDSHPELNDVTLVELLRRGSELVRHATQIIETDAEFWIGERSLEIDGAVPNADLNPLEIGRRGNLIAESLASDQAGRDLQLVFQALMLARARQPTDKLSAGVALGQLVERVNGALSGAGQSALIESAPAIAQMNEALGSARQMRPRTSSHAGVAMVGRQAPPGAPPQPEIPLLEGVETRVFLDIDEDPISPRFNIYWGPADLEPSSRLKHYSISEQTNAVQLRDVLASDVDVSRLRLLDSGQMAGRVTADMIAEILGERLPKNRATRFGRNQLLRLRMEDPDWHPSIVPNVENTVPWTSSYSRLIIEHARHEDAHTVRLTLALPDGTHFGEIALHDLTRSLSFGRIGRVDQSLDTAGDRITGDDLRQAALIAYCRTPESRLRIFGDPQSDDQILLSFAGIDRSDVIALQSSDVEMRTEASGAATTDTLRPGVVEPRIAKDLLTLLGNNELVDLGQRVYRTGDGQSAIYARLLLEARALEPGGEALLFMVHGAIKDTHKEPPSVWALARSDTYGWQLFAVNEAEGDLPTAVHADSDLYKLIQPIVTNRTPVVLGTAPIGDDAVVIDAAMDRAITEKRVILELTTGTRTRHDMVSLITDERHPLRRVLARIDRNDDRTFSERRFVFNARAGSLIGGTIDASADDIATLVEDLQLVFLDDYRLQIRHREGQYNFSVVPVDRDDPDWVTHLKGRSTFEGQEIVGLYLRPFKTADAKVAGEFAEPVLAVRAGTGRFRLVPFVLEERVAVPVRRQSEELTRSQFHQRRATVLQPVSSAVRWNTDESFAIAGVPELTEDGRAAAWLHSLTAEGLVCSMPHRNRFVDGEFARVVIPRNKTALCLDYDVSADGSFELIKRNVLKASEVTRLMKSDLMQQSRPEIRAILGDAWQLRDGYELLIVQPDVEQQVFVDLDDPATAWRSPDINLVVRVGENVHGVSVEGDSALNVWSSPAAEVNDLAAGVHEIDVASVFDKAFGDSPRNRSRLYEVLGDTARSVLLRRHLETAREDNVFRTVDGDVVEVVEVDVDENLVFINTRGGERLMPVGALAAMLESPVVSIDDERDHSLGERIRATLADMSDLEIGANTLAPGYLDQLSRTTLDRALADPCPEHIFDGGLF